MSYENVYACLDLKVDLQLVQIDQLREGLTKDGTKILLCTQYDEDFHILREVLGLDISDLPVITIPFYKIDYLKNYYEDLLDDQPVADMPEMEFDQDAKEHIVNKRISVIPFKEMWEGGWPDLWKNQLNTNAKYGDFGLMFFAKDAKNHINNDNGFPEDVRQHWVKTTLDFASKHSEEVTVVFCGIS